MEPEKEWNLFLDDLRETSYLDNQLRDNGKPYPKLEYIVARTYAEAVELVGRLGCPKFIAFDNDLGEEKEGYDFAKYLVKADLDCECDFIPLDFDWEVHSSNPVARRNINYFLARYMELKGMVANGTET